MTDSQRPYAYIAGPMRGHEDCNFPAFDQAALYLDAAGFTPVNPAEIDRVLEGWGRVPPDGYEPSLEDRKRFIRRDLLALIELDPARGDIIYMLEGWAESTGARAEHALARFLGLGVWYEGPKEQEVFV